MTKQIEGLVAELRSMASDFQEATKDKHIADHQVDRDDVLFLIHAADYIESTRSGVVDEAGMRDELAAICAQWDAGYRETSIEWARKYLADCKDKEHSGDCTKCPWTCLRCTCDDAFKQADQIIAAMRRVSKTDEGK